MTSSPGTELGHKFIGPLFQLPGATARIAHSHTLPSADDPSVTTSTAQPTTPSHRRGPSGSRDDTTPDRKPTLGKIVETRGIEPLTPALQRCTRIRAVTSATDSANAR
ncbi:hypothetical protein SAMN05216174_104305 [Actinokineospora iranica]|uniref:Uncharacterized protein n=1 Tax=Actinokineospora iranica TaxID=1271860 RepID=A0A1G6PI40_9PSEU|nr:hypothetical protein SAMN05216174_104305 [Actinokineospora iranica]